MKTPSLKTAALVLGLSLGLGACASKVPTGPRPELASNLPTQWQTPASTKTETAAPISATWWQEYQSAELSRLMTQAFANSPDLQIAALRVSQAEGSVRVAGASLFPTLALAGSTRSNYQDGKQTGNNSQLSLGAAYEIDLWGKLSANNQSAEASLNASKFDQQSARLSLQSGLASAYFQILSLRDRVKVTEQNLVIAENILRIVEARAANGVASGLDVSRQRSAVVSARAALLPLQQQERQTLAALAILIGNSPQGFQVESKTLDGLAVPAVTPGLPSDLLIRRPDLASSEAALVAADANVAAARAAMLPTFVLSGSNGLASNFLLGLSNPSNSFSFTLALAQNLFDAGKQRSQAEITEAKRLELVQGYRKSILTALKEVEDALSDAERLRQQE